MFYQNTHTRILKRSTVFLQLRLKIIDCF